MSEEEIIKEFNSLIDNARANWVVDDYETLQKMLDLYNKEKEKNLCIEILRKDMPEDTEFVIMTKQAFENNPACEYIKKGTIVNKIEELKKDMLGNGKTIDILYDILLKENEEND